MADIKRRRATDDEFLDALTADDYMSLLGGPTTPAQIPEQPADSSQPGFGRDLAVGVAKGVISLPDIPLGLIGLADGGATARAFKENVYDPAAYRKAFDEVRSEGGKQAAAEYDKTTGFFDAAGNLIANPGFAATLAAESLPSIAAGGLGARAIQGVAGLAGKKLGAATAAGAGEGAVIAGQTAESIRSQDPDGDLSAGQRLLAAGAGAGGALIGAGGGALARRFGAGNVDELGLANRAAQQVAPATGSAIGRVVGGGIKAGGVESVEEGGQSALETVAENAGLGRPLDQDLGKNIGTGAVLGGMMGVPGGVLEAGTRGGGSGPGQVPPGGLPPAAPGGAGPAGRPGVQFPGATPGGAIDEFNNPRPSAPSGPLTRAVAAAGAAVTAPVPENSNPAPSNVDPETGEIIEEQAQAGPLGRFATADEAKAFINAVKRSGTNITGLPIQYEDGSFGVAAKGTPEYETALSQFVSRESGVDIGAPQAAGGALASVDAAQNPVDLEQLPTGQSGRGRVTVDSETGQLIYDTPANLEQAGSTEVSDDRPQYSPVFTQIGVDKPGIPGPGRNASIGVEQPRLGASAQGSIESRGQPSALPAPSPQSGDIVAKSGQHFRNKLAATKALKSAGPGAQVVQVAENAFVVRPLEVSNGGIDDVGAVPAGAVAQPGAESVGGVDSPGSDAAATVELRGDSGRDGASPGPGTATDPAVSVPDSGADAVAGDGEATVIRDGVATKVKAKKLKPDAVNSAFALGGQAVAPISEADQNDFGAGDSAPAATPATAKATAAPARAKMTKADRGQRRLEAYKAATGKPDLDKPDPGYFEFVKSKKAELTDRDGPRPDGESGNDWDAELDSLIEDAATASAPEPAPETADDVVTTRKREGESDEYYRKRLILDRKMRRVKARSEKGFYQAEKSREKERTANRARAKSMLEQHGTRMAEKMAPGIAKRFGISETQARRKISAELKGMVRTDPGLLLRMIEGELRKSDEIPVGTEVEVKAIRGGATGPKGKVAGLSADGQTYKVELQGDGGEIKVAAGQLKELPPAAEPAAPVTVEADVDTDAEISRLESITSDAARFGQAARSAGNGVDPGSQAYDDFYVDFNPNREALRASKDALAARKEIFRLDGELAAESAKPKAKRDAQKIKDLEAELAVAKLAKLDALRRESPFVRAFIGELDKLKNADGTPLIKGGFDKRRNAVNLDTASKIQKSISRQESAFQDDGVTVEAPATPAPKPKKAKPDANAKAEAGLRKALDKQEANAGEDPFAGLNPESKVDSADPFAGLNGEKTEAASAPAVSAIEEIESDIGDLNQQLIDENEQLAEARANGESKAEIESYKKQVARTKEALKRAKDRLAEAKNALPVFNLGPASPAAGKTIPAASVRSLVTAVSGKWANGPEVVVIEDMFDAAIPKTVRDAYFRQQEGGATGDVYGFYLGGKTYIVAGSMKSEQDVLTTLFHESLGHAGLRGLYGKDLSSILQRVATLRAKDVDAKMAEYGLPANERLTAAEEVLASLAETNPNMGWARQAVAAVRSWLRANVPGFSKMQLSDAEIIRDYIIPARNFIQRGGPVAKSATASAATDGIGDASNPVFSLKNPSPITRAKNICWRRFKIEPPCRLNFEPGLLANR